MKTKRLAIIFPGMGYHKDKPLLYYSSKLAQGKDYEIINIEYHDLPEKVRGDAEKMKAAADIAYKQAEEQLEGVAFSAYEDILFIGKSIGTVIAAKYAMAHDLKVRQIWYTPVEATFSFGLRNAIAFIGEADPWSDLNNVRKLAAENGIELWTYPECNHSLESADVIRNIEYMTSVMRLTKEFIER
jgi:phosphoglycolate phosphatase